MKDEVQDNIRKRHGEFNHAEPPQGHFERFNARLNESQKQNSPKKRGLLSYFAIAASLLILLGFGLNNAWKQTNSGLAAVSPEMNETQSYFSSLIRHELAKIEGKKTKENEKVIGDALKHIEILEKEYKSLEEELIISGNNPKIIYAMVNNFQKRIDILQLLINQMELLKIQQKQQEDEKLLV